MDTNPVTLTHSSNKPAGLPPLSPPFIRDDDAAYWAHRQIRHSPQWEFGGVILQDADGLFRATQPTHGEASNFYFDAVLPANTLGQPIAPAGFKVAAIYHSRQLIHDQVRATGLSDPEVRLLISSFAPTEMLFNITVSEIVPSAYLSGPDGSLIKYVASGNAVEHALHDRLVSQIHTAVQQDFVHSLILECAAAGQLWVVVANADWGGVRGRVKPTWRPWSAVTSKVEAQPLCTRVYAQSDRAVTAALAESAAVGPITSGFVLKGRQGYVATWPLPAAQPWFLPAALFPVDAKSAVRLPEHCTLQGAYATVPRAGGISSSVQQPWLYKVMFSPVQLAAGIGQLRAHAALRNAQAATSLYFQTSDDTVLRYNLSGSPQEATLVVEHPPGVFNDDGSEERMRTGALLAQDYVLRVAQAGELSVLRPGAVWDEKTTVTQDWQPYSSRRPSLSPLFVTADDAARYAHAQIDYRRDSNYAALILQRADQRFVVTEPVFTDRPRFALDAVYPVDDHGEPIMLTPGCHLHALFCSRVKPKPLSGLREHEVQVAAQMFMDTDIHTVLSNLKVVSRAYLSGSVDSLLAYTSQNLQSYTERELLERVTPTHGNSQVARELSEGTLLPSAFVREQAYPERLRVVIASRLWGGVGSLPEDWEPNNASEASLLPQTPLLGAVFATAQEAVQDVHDRTLDRYGRSPTSLGVVLRHRSLAQYVATPGVAAELLDRLLNTCRFSGVLQDTGFEVHSVYVSGVRVAEGVSTPGHWLARHFIAPGDLHAALYDNVGARRLPLTQSAVVYIATLEGATLEYVAGAADGVFGEDTKQGLSALKREIQSAALSTAGYVLRVAGSGDLRVLRGSECWDRQGKVDARWAAFSRVMRRRLSPAFSCADDAARYASMSLGARRDKVYGGLILRSTAGLFVATEPMAVHVESFDVQWVRSRELVDRGLFLGGSTVVAFYHSCSPYEPQFPTTDVQWHVYRNMFSTAFVADVLRALSTEGDTRDDYLLCNDGALLHYRFNGSIAQKALAAELNIVRAEVQWHLYNPIEEQIRSGTLQPEEWVNRLAHAGPLTVVQGSRLWGAERRIASFMAYSTAQDRALGDATQVDIGMSPLFTQAQDAARYLHRADKLQEHSSFAFILKASGREHYMATPPLPRYEDLTLERVFADGQLPQGFLVNGLYMHVSKYSNLGGTFFWPRDLAWGLAAAARHGGVPLYIACADGALLMLDASNPAVELASAEAASRYDSELQRGAVTLVSYLHKVAAGNKLRVLQGSPFWFGTTLVTAQWQPYKASPAPAFSDHRFALSPIFLHSDDAARYTQRLIGPYTGDDYLGAILEDVQRRAYVAVEPLKDNDPDAVPSAEERLFWKPSRASTSDHEVPLAEYPQGHRIVMTHQLYKSDFAQGKNDPATTLGSNFISWSYMFTYTRGLRGYFDIQNYYLSTRDGALLRYTPDFSADSKEETMVHEFRHIGVYDARQMLALMTPYKTLTVVRPGRFWTRPGLIEGAAATVVQESTLMASLPVSPEEGFHRERDEF